jgi:uncharacterized protein YndB with AHSA1/START domain
MTELVSKRGEYIRASAAEVWRALTDPDMTEQYLRGARVQSTWVPGDEIAYLLPDGATRLLEGKLLEVVPNRRLVFECRLLFDPRFAAEKPHRETFEIDDLGEVCYLTATFDEYEPNSLSYAFACDSRGGMDLTGSSLKSLLETGTPIKLAIGPRA